MKIFNNEYTYMLVLVTLGFT